MQQPDKVNKDLILREKLAIERTVMANDRTLLSFIRTALYFIVAGLTINELLNIRYGYWVALGFFVVGVGLLATGIIKYLQQLQKIRESRRHIGNYLLQAEEA